jgi:hypothetical protein
MKFLSRHIVVIFLLAAFHPLYSGDKQATEEEIFSGEIDSVITQAVGGFHLPPAASLRLRMHDMPVNKYFHQAIVNSLLQHSIRVYDEKIEMDTTLEINIKETSIRFGETFSESIFGPKLVERTVSFSVDATLQASGRFYSLPVLAATSVDTVEYSATQHSQSTSIPLTSYIEPSVSWFDSIFEPVVVTVAAGVAVYLFFSIRS